MSRKAYNRRDFVKTGSLGLLGGYLTLKSGRALAGMMGGGSGGGGMGGGGGGMGGGGGVIDPPAGALLADPVAMPFTNPAAGVVEVNLGATINQVNVNGTMANLVTYNGCYPGPTIKVRKGDILRVNFANALPPTASKSILGFSQNITNLHTHGWHVSPDEPMDNVMRQFLPGQSTGSGDASVNPHPPFLYDTSRQEAGTLCYYHPHIHGLTAEQVWGGLGGCLVTEDPDTLLSGFETHILVLKDITVSGGAPAPYTSSMEYMQGKEGNTVMVNGQVNPVLTAKTGQVQRWRILNASNARFYKLSLANHSLQVIGTDGGLLDKPYPQSYILLSPGERVDILIKASPTAGTFKFLSLPYSRMGMMSSAQITLLTLVVGGGAANDTIPSSINSNARRLNPNSLKIAGQKTFTLSMSGGRGYINGYDFDVKPYVATSQMNTYEFGL